MTAHSSPSRDEDEFNFIICDVDSAIDKRKTAPKPSNAKLVPKNPPDLDALLKKIRFFTMFIVLAFVVIVVTLLKVLPELSLPASVEVRDAVTVLVLVVIFGYWKFFRKGSRWSRGNAESTSPRKPASALRKSRPKRNSGEIPDLKEDPGYDAVNYFGKDDPDVRRG